MKIPFAALTVLAFLPSVAAQDIRGLEVCTAEKQMERRTSCLQANTEFLHQALAKLTRETNSKLSEGKSDLAATKAEIAALKSAVAKLESELAQMRAKADPTAKK
jgi:ubiquinone biosynthesis protein UbiJ